MSKIVPNQQVVIIKKTPVKTDFLQISNKEWMFAAKDFDKNFNAFKIYLYLASNEVDYEKGLSFQDISNKLGIGSSSYYAVKKFLLEKGYLVDIGGNRLEFYSTPFRQSGKVENDLNSATAENSARTEKVENYLLSARMENSATAEKVYETFNF